jgi:hypothetical protein
VLNPIDAFVAAEHARHDLTARPSAPAHVLLRRVYLDLTGLPPTAEQLQAFLADSSADAYEKVVDQLLASPQYAERWGRHWMDVWRYSDWAGWGEQVRDSMPHVWRWRDWIVESLDADKPYDRMILEMLAADELCPEDADALRATGFLVRNFKRLSREQWMQDTVNHTTKAFLGMTLDCARCHDHMYDPVSQQEYYQFRAIFEPYNVRTDRVPGQVEVEKDGLVRAFDAELAAPTYFYVRGDERQADKDKPLVPAVPEQLGGSFAAQEISLPTLAYIPDKRDFVADDDVRAATERASAARSKWEEAQPKLGEAEASLIQSGSDAERMKAVDTLRREVQGLEIEAHLAEAKRDALVATLAAERLDAEDPQAPVEEREQAAKNALAAQRRQAVCEKRQEQFVAEEAVRSALLAAAEAENNLAAQPNEANLQAQRDMASQAADEARKKLTAADEALRAAEQEESASLTTDYKKRDLHAYPQTSTGRRLALARWIVDAQNPRTARVAINHIWLRHFGQPLVSSVFDFGNNGQPPTHPALLDWLASEFMQPSLSLSPSAQGREWQAAQSPGVPWSMKHVHRLIVTSNTYRMASAYDEASAKLDPDNRFLWCMPERRMEAEVVRDCVLYVCGQLDLTRGGPDIDYEQGLQVPRRSMYFRHAPEKQMTFLRLFDAASPVECYRRKESIIPQQALALANSSLALEQSRRLARKLNDEYPDANDFLQIAFQQVLARPATADEVAACLVFLSEQESFFSQNAERLTAVATDADDVVRPAADNVLRARENLVHVLLNHHDFVTIR